MRPLDVDHQLRRRPFVPLRMHFSDGTHYEVRHPEAILVSERVLALTLPGRPGARLPAGVVMIDPLHVVRMEPINGHGEPPAPADGIPPT